MKSAPGLGLTDIGELNRHDPGYLYQQLSTRIRRLVAGGVLTPGAKLPSSRTLSRRLSISRNSVATAYEMLIADGWLEAHGGSGTYVAAAPPVSLTPAQRNAIRVRNAPVETPFAVGPTAVELFPMQEWRKIQARRWSRMSREALLAQHPAGWADLREAICAHVAITRGVACAPEQVLVNSSARMSVDLSIRALGLIGKEVWLEDPGFHVVDGHLTSMVRAAPVRVDAEGLDVVEGLRTHPGASAALVTPSCHFPTGAPMSVARRKALLDWSNATGGWVIEDDYDSEFVFEGRPPPPLFSERTKARVLYVGTFNKVMFPALRIAYVVVPEFVIDRFMAATEQLGDYPSIPNQIVLGDFIEAGGLDRHLARSRAAYAERRAVLLDADFGARARIERHWAGLHVQLTAEGMDSRYLEQVCRDAGPHVLGMHRFKADGAPGRSVLLGFSGFTPAQLRQGVARLQTALAD